MSGDNCVEPNKTEWSIWYRLFSRSIDRYQTESNKRGNICVSCLICMIWLANSFWVVKKAVGLLNRYAQKQMASIVLFTRITHIDSISITHVLLLDDFKISILLYLVKILLRIEAWENCRLFERFWSCLEEWKFCWFASRTDKRQNFESRQKSQFQAWDKHTRWTQRGYIGCKSFETIVYRWKWQSIRDFIWLKETSWENSQAVRACQNNRVNRKEKRKLLWKTGAD